MRNLNIVIIIFFVMFSSPSFGQSGVGMRSPHASAALDLNTTNKGLLLPIVSFTTAVGLANNNSPVSNPQLGSLVYNTGGDFAKGGYYWNGSAWGKLVISDGVDQNLNLQINEYVNPSYVIGETTTAVASGTTGTYIDLSKAVIASSFTLGTYQINANNTLTLPKGNYKLDISLDCLSPDAPNTSSATNNGYFGSAVHLLALQAEIHTSAGSILNGTTTKVAAKIAEPGNSSLQNYKYQFVFSLAAPTDIKLFFKNDNGSSDVTRKTYRKYGLVANFYRLKTL